jgi:TRAP-type C4-dicarboxylate transport system permease small subunit
VLTCGSQQNQRRRFLKAGNGLARFEKFVYWLSSWFEHIAIVGFLGMVASTLVDVVGAKAFHYPLPSGTEAVYLFQIIAIAGAMAYGEIDGRHIRVELFVDMFSRKARAFFHGLAAFLGLGLFVILTWKGYQYGMSLLAHHDVTATSRIPIYPFALWLGLCCVPVCLVLIGEILKAIMEGIKK